MSIVCNLLGHKYKQRPNVFEFTLKQGLTLLVEVQTCKRCGKHRFGFFVKWSPISKDGENVGAEFSYQSPVVEELDVKKLIKK